MSEYPDDVSAIMAIAEFHLRRGRNLEALQAYQKVVSLKEGTHREVDVNAHLGLARIFMLQNMIIEAYKELLYVFEIAPRNVEGRVLYTWLSHIEQPPSDTQEAFGNYQRNEQPELQDLKVFRHQKELERSILDQEISQFESIMNEHEGEPIYEYHYEMAILRKKHMEEMMNYIDILESHIGEEEISPEAAPLPPEEFALPEGEELAPATPFEVEGFETETMTTEPPITEIEAAEEASPEGHVSPIEIAEEMVISPETEGIGIFEGETTSEEDEMIIPEVEESIVEEGEIDEGIEEAVIEAAIDEVVSEVSEDSTHLSVLEDLLGAEEISSPPQPEVTEEKSAVSSARVSFYESIRESVTTVLANLIKTKGVTVVMTAAKDAFIIDSILNETIDSQEIAGYIKSGMEIIADYRDDEAGKAFLYWVLEFEQGLLVIRSIDGNHFLLALAKGGANFGAMRYSMEKEKETLVEILSGAPSDLFVAS